jgi:hypothetical protein
MTNSRKIVALQLLLHRGKRPIIDGAKDLTLKMSFAICEFNVSHLLTIFDYKNRKKLDPSLQIFSRITVCYCNAVC